MKKIVLYTVLGLFLFLIFLVANAPAVWLAEIATRVSNGSVTLAAADGTFWRGTGNLYAGGPATNVRELGRLRWQVNPLWLIFGRVQVAVQLEGPGTRGQATVRVGRRDLHIQNLFATFPAPLASAVYPPATFFAPTGTLEVKAPSLEINREGLTGTAEGQWRGAGGRFTAGGSIGDYRAELTGNGATAQIKLATLNGDLELAGQGQWRVVPDGDFQFNGTAMPKGEAVKLEPMLRLLGRDLGGGRREVKFAQRLPIVQQMGFDR